MPVTKFICAFSAALFASSLSAAAQQPTPAASTPPSSQQIKLDVVVGTKSGQPVTTLGQQDFTILDNGEFEINMEYVELIRKSDPDATFLISSGSLTECAMNEGTGKYGPLSSTGRKLGLALHQTSAIQTWVVFSGRSG
ncbi:MAG: hypothetical protein WDM87_11615 [Terracidiphilus sp.]